jgi:hypothetical protein
MKKFITAISSALLVTALLVPFASFNTVNNLPHDWEKLGERKVNFTVDRDEIAVGKFEGFFDALQIKVKKGPINMHKMVVHFNNGGTKEIPLKNKFAAGGQSRVIDLPGNVRVIEKVVFWYDTKNFASSKAVVELWGRH